MFTLKNIYLFPVFLFILILLPLSVFSGQIEDIYKDLTILEKTQQIGRKSYTVIGDKFYKIYSDNPSGKYADEALLGAARTYRRAFERFKMQSDLDKSLNYYRMLQGAFSSSAARKAYIESADIFISRRDYTSAKFTLNKLIQKHPSSSEAVEAKTKMASIGSNTAQSSVTQPRPEPPAAASNNTQASGSNQANETNLATEKNSNLISVSAGQNSGATASGKPVAVHGIRYFSDKDYTRIVIDLSNNAEYESRWLKADEALHKPPRLSIDINNSSLDAAAPRNLSIKDGLLSAVRIGYHPQDKRTRVVLDSENVKDFTVFQMSSPSRIVVDVFAAERTNDVKRPTIVASGNKTAGAPAAPAKPQEEKTPAKDTAPPMNRPKTPDDLPKDITLSAALGLKIRTIVVDPGHGGKDPGAVYNNLKEKDIVLEIGKYLYEYLKADTNLNIHLTRSTDIFIPLEERTAIANKLKADIFVSIHANAAKNKMASGLETFVFNVTNDRAALEVAALENQATTKSISELQGILKDILKYSKLEESVSLASSVQKRLVKNVNATQKKNLGVKQAPFYVLVGATMPAILVETGFLSNNDDAAKLKSSAYRKKIAKGIYDAIKEYISKYNN
ncbi:MAG: N-acetylmuramoyl-L-alanine amidase [Mucispirillum sp.]|nr:N-acetylmuramoyl-L-alanine amidase [Mucispirillum sp.]